MAVNAGRKLRGRGDEKLWLWQRWARVKTVNSDIHACLTARRNGNYESGTTTTRTAAAAAGSSTIFTCWRRRRCCYHAAPHLHVVGCYRSLRVRHGVLVQLQMHQTVCVHAIYRPQLDGERECKQCCDEDSCKDGKRARSSVLVRRGRVVLLVDMSGVGLRDIVRGRCARVKERHDSDQQNRQSSSRMGQTMK